MFLAYSVWIFVTLLALLPIVHHAFFGRRERRREILDFFDTEAIKQYFRRFYHARYDKFEADPTKYLTVLHDQRFGLRSFIFPLLFYIGVLALATLVVVSITIAPIFEIALSFDNYNALIAYALAGAYLWVVSDLLSRWRQRDIGPSALFNWAFRFVISIPIGLTLAAIMKEQFAAPMAFLLGAFPTNTLITFLRRQASDRLKLGDNADDKRSELEAIQGITTTIAEKFGEIGVTTLVRLAYEDPIQLAMRLNLPFVFVLDVVSQALVGMYFKDLDIARKYSIRGSIEALFLYRSLQDEDSDGHERAKIVVKDMATDLKVSPETLEETLSQIAEDPATEFLESLPY
jgi:hypothetical protein